MKKKFYLLTALCFGCFSKNHALNPDSTYKLNQSKSEFFFQFINATPTGAFGNSYAFDSSDLVVESLTKSIEGKMGGFGGKSGFGAEIGGYFYFNKNRSKNSLGMKVSFISYASHSFHWDADGDYIINNAEYKPLKLFSIKIGPCFRTSLSNDIALRIYYQLGPVFSSNGEWEYNDSYVDDIYTVSDHSYFKLNRGSGIKHELGFAINYHWIFAGLGLSFSNINYNNVEFYRNTVVQVPNYSGSYNLVGSQTISENFSVKAPTNFWFFFIGIKTGK